MCSPRQILPLFLASTLPLALSAPASNSGAELITRDYNAPNPFPPGGWDATSAGLLDYTGNTAWPIAANELDIPWCMHDGLDNVGTFLNYGVLIPDDSKYDTGGCGAGFLDNLRGRCGVISSWGCDLVGADNTTAALSFLTPNTCSEWDVTQAILAASYGDLNIACNYASGTGGGDVPPIGGFGGDGK